ncbi:MAG: hypothetical protein ACT6S0_00615 [Roseateles sp.]|uniref:hypothetical protein n=1 Tax=Roseateles sp. TaxID=1971397 RepID=UPI004036D1F0
MENTKDDLSEEPAVQPQMLREEQAAKTISDLDDLVQAVLKSLPSSKPWQRQLHAYLNDIDRLTQVLRMTVAMNRPAGEVGDAAQDLRTALRVAQRYVGTGRADFGTKAAVGIACELGVRIDATLSA